MNIIPLTDLVIEWKFWETSWEEGISSWNAHSKDGGDGTERRICHYSDTTLFSKTQDFRRLQRSKSCTTAIMAMSWCTNSRYLLKNDFSPLPLSTWPRHTVVNILFTQHITPVLSKSNFYTYTPQPCCN